MKNKSLALPHTASQASYWFSGVMDGVFEERMAEGGGAIMTPKKFKLA